MLLSCSPKFGRILEKVESQTPAVKGENLAPFVQFQKEEVHPIFLLIFNFRLGKSSSIPILASFIRVSPVIEVQFS